MRTLCIYLPHSWIKFVLDMMMSVIIWNRFNRLIVKSPGMQSLSQIELKKVAVQDVHKTPPAAFKEVIRPEIS